jgi:hypothetical protein
MAPGNGGIVSNNFFTDGPLYAEWSDLMGRLRAAFEEQQALRAQRSAMMDRKRREGIAADQAEFNVLTRRIKQLDDDRRELTVALDALKAVADAAADAAKRGAR